jgi:hypothetical protein
MKAIFTSQHSYSDRVCLGKLDYCEIGIVQYATTATTSDELL